MPSYYNLTAAQDVGVEDVDKFARMPFFLVENEQVQFPQVDDFTKLWGDINWQPNMGDTMRAIRPEPSPIGNALFYPNRINTDPGKDVFENLETQEEMVLRWHDYQSKMINFLPSWQDFRDNQLSFGHKDIVRQVANGHNTFIRTVIWDKSPYVYFAGAALGSELVDAPTGTGNVAQTAGGSKTSNWLAGMIAALGDDAANLSWSVLKSIANIAFEDCDIPPFEGAKNVIAPNEMLKGRILVYASNDALIQLTDDGDVIQRKSLQDDILFAEFKGPFCNGMVTWKSQRYPLRCNADGVFIVPQLTEQGSNKTRKNPAYRDAQYEIAWVFGAGAYRTVKVGPPPKDFSSMTKDKFWKMRWNGEVRLTDQFLITRGTIAGGDFRQELNDDGRFLKFKATQVMHGLLPGEVYNAFPVVFKRRRRRGQNA